MPIYIWYDATQVNTKSDLSYGMTRDATSLFLILQRNSPISLGFFDIQHVGFNLQKSFEFISGGRP